MHECNQANGIKRYPFQLVLRRQTFRIPAGTPTILTKLLVISIRSLYAVTMMVLQIRQ
jgi:hypothetical protein